MNDVIPFTHETFGILRTTTINDKPWFVATDICRSLNIKNSSNALTRLDDAEKSTALIDTRGGKQKLSVVSEEGLYSLVLGSRKSQAKSYKNWVVKKVMPFICNDYEQPVVLEQENIISTDVSVYEDQEFGKVRVEIINGNPWFLGKDVATILGYTNPANALNLHCKEDGVAFYTLIDTLGRSQEAKFISEGNLYRLIAHSKLPNAERFEKWIFDEVVPSIRKNGIYATNETIDKILDNPDFGIRLLQQLKDERQKNTALQETVNIQAKKIEEDAPKVTYYDLVLQSPDLLATKDIAGDYGMTAQTMNKLLHEFGVQYKTGKIWHLYAKYNGKGYAKTTTETFHNHTRLWLKWSQQGRLFIYDLMKEHGYLPSCEQIMA